MRKVNRLDAAFVRQNSILIGKHPDGNNLYLSMSSDSASS
jgi:hypothetical protein